MQRAVAQAIVDECEQVTMSKKIMDEASNELQEFLNCLYDVTKLVGRAIGRPPNVPSRCRAAEAAAVRMLDYYCKCTQEEMEGRVHDAYMALLPCLGVIKDGKHFY
jgi:hypothetical protein